MAPGSSRDHADDEEAVSLIQAIGAAAMILAAE
jgi:hypothetical protein